MPRAGLNEERVVEEAEQLVDQVGVARLTLAALAARLGVRQPSLYKHIDGLPALLRTVSIRAKVDLGDVLARAAVGRSKGDAITSMSGAYRSWAQKHPGRYELAQRAPLTGDSDDEAASAAVVQVCADVLSGFDLLGDDAIDAIRTMRSALHGFVALEASGGFGMDLSTDRSFQWLVRGLVAAFTDWANGPRRS